MSKRDIGLLSYLEGFPVLSHCTGAECSVCEIFEHGLPHERLYQLNLRLLQTSLPFLG